MRGVVKRKGVDGLRFRKRRATRRGDERCRNGVEMDDYSCRPLE